MNSAKHILIADDDDNIYKVIEFLVKRKTSFIPVRAKNGMEALHFAMINYRINLIIMDIKMPVLDSLEATRRIKTIRPHLPIISISALPLEEEKGNILASGCDFYLPKPVSPENLLLTINKFIK